MLSAITDCCATALQKTCPAAQKAMDDLARTGISMKEVTDKLTDDGVKLFADAFDKLAGGGVAKEDAQRRVTKG